MPSYRKFEQHVAGELEALNTQIMEKSGKLLSLHKAFFIKEYDTIFEGKYPLLCVQDASSEKQQVRAQSRFPTEIKKDLLFLGNMMNIMNKDYF